MPLKSQADGEEKVTVTLKPEYFHDSNIFETRYKIEKDTGQQLWIHFNYKYRGAKLPSKLRWICYLKKYDNYTEDNRFSQVLQWQSFPVLSKHLIVSTNMIHKSKLWFHWGILHYQFHLAGSVQYRIFKLSLATGINSFSDYSSLNTQYFMGSISGRWRLNRDLIIIGNIEISHWAYGKIFKLSLAEKEEIKPINSVRPVVAIERRGKYLFRTEAFCDFRNSPSRLYRSIMPGVRTELSYKKKALIITGIIQLRRKFYATYSGEDEQIIPDPEEEVLSETAFSAEYFLFSSATVSIKYIHMDGETIYRGIYYHKTVLTAGISYRF